MSMMDYLTDDERRMIELAFHTLRRLSRAGLLLPVEARNLEEFERILAADAAAKGGTS